MSRGRREGARRRFSGAIRRRSNLILALSVALLGAALLGVQLGQSAISEINPVHFRGAAAPPRAIDADAPRPAPNAFASAYGWDQAHEARAAECGADCDARQARDALVFALDRPVPARRAGEPYWRDATPTTEPAAWPPGETGRGDLSVERYMHYPVEAEAVGEADAKPAPAEDEAAPPE